MELIKIVVGFFKSYKLGWDWLECNPLLRPFVCLGFAIEQTYTGIKNKLYQGGVNFMEKMYL